MSLLAIAAVSLGSFPSGEDALELVRNAFASSCVECHAGERPKAGLELTGDPLEIARADPELWLELIDRVELGEMPPARGESPAGLPQDARTALVAVHYGHVIAVCTVTGHRHVRRARSVPHGSMVHAAMVRSPVIHVGHSTACRCGLLARRYRFGL